MFKLKSLFTAPKQEAKLVTNPIDMVVYASGLVSNIGDIDPFLDKMRIITSQLGPDQEPTPADRRELLEIYIAVEEYLVTKEPLRQFTKEQVRSRLSPELRTELEKL